MPAYNLTAPEMAIVTSWLYEPSGYLDVAINATGTSARAALTQTPSLDVYQWIRTQTKGATVGQTDWNECGMVWWIRSHDQLNITPPTRPPETSAWIATLTAWDESITPAAIQRATDAGTSITLTTEAGTVTTQPLGQNRNSQKTLFGKVLGVLS